MTAAFELSELAEQDVRDQFRYFARSDRELAQRFTEAVFATCQRLAETPDLGSPWLNDDPNLQDLLVWRLDTFNNHLAFYRVAGDVVIVERVLHGARDLETILSRTAR